MNTTNANISKLYALRRFLMVFGPPKRYLLMTTAGV
jgi:hypothetical protein